MSGLAHLATSFPLLPGNETENCQVRESQWWWRKTEKLFSRYSLAGPSAPLPRVMRHRSHLYEGGVFQWSNIHEWQFYFRTVNKGRVGIHANDEGASIQRSQHIQHACRVRMCVHGPVCYRKEDDTIANSIRQRVNFGLVFDPQKNSTPESVGSDFGYRWCDYWLVRSPCDGAVRSMSTMGKGVRGLHRNKRGVGEQDAIASKQKLKSHK